MATQLAAPTGRASAAGLSINLLGGLPIVLGGEVLGAVGVGSGSDDEDMATAQAACTALLDALKA